MWADRIAGIPERGEYPVRLIAAVFNLFRVVEEGGIVRFDLNSVGFKRFLNTIVS
jgi:hypothetical protein